MRLLLAAVDGSERARGVVDVAVALAARHEARVLLMQVVTMPRVPIGTFAMSEEHVLKVLEREAADDLRSLEAHVPTELRAGVRIAFGDPRDQIERVSEAENVDLIVIGAHGHRAIDRIMGTTAARVVNHATRSVFVVRVPERITGAPR